MIYENNIPVLDKEIQYWIIRSGIENAFFEEFYQHNCIAVGWDRINEIEKIKDPYYDIQTLKLIVKLRYPELKKFTRSESSYSRKISDIARKIYRFINEVNIGDIIVTPGRDEILIGEIIGEPYLVSGYSKDINELELIGSLNKARDVRWIKRIRREELEPNFRAVLGVYHGIANIKNQQVITEINRSIYSFYKQGDRGHSIFRIKEETEVDFEKYAYFIKVTSELYDKFSPQYGNQKMTIKTNVQSPGPIELIGDFGLISTMVLALRVFFKNDNKALDEMEPDSKKIMEEYKEDNELEHDYDDYDFPSHGQY